MDKTNRGSEVYDLSDRSYWDRLPIGILIFSKNTVQDRLPVDAVCKYCNPMAYELIKIDNIVGQTLGTIWGGDDSVPENFPLELFFPATEKWGLVQLGAIQGHEVMVTITDISYQKLQIQLLHSRINNLQLSNRDLEHFAYVASHDLQEPLRKIVSFGERLEQKAKNVLQPEHQLYLDRMVSATRRMQSLIDNLLEYSRLTRRNYEFVPIDLNKVLTVVLNYLQQQISEKEAIVQHSTLPIIAGDEIQLTALFQNLLSNALKFISNERIPIININVFNPELDLLIQSGLPVDHKYIGIRVADNGIGFNQDQANVIFTLFSRLRGRSEFEGTGLGLPICKRVAENHHGIIFAKGEPDVGAEFTIILPFEQIDIDGKKGVKNTDC